ncbi:hypothetical protein KT71_003388 [Congregibacter litoralis KT71]|uniref:Uncharacterized protein n=1 Tax=Congregibacter litoralis KT71 TaxID=314285 RepID=V7HS26_9GAMM|nr:hypothetical protein KT71_003388 [Congregibacter litoralis KT71]
MYPIERGRPSVYFPPCRGSSSPFTELHGQGGLHPEDTVPGRHDPGGLRAGGLDDAHPCASPSGRPAVVQIGSPADLPLPVWRRWCQSRGSTSPATMAFSLQTTAGVGSSRPRDAGRASSLSPTQKSAHPRSATPIKRGGPCRYDLGSAAKACFQHRHAPGHPLLALRANSPCRGLQSLWRICQGHRMYRGPGRHRPDPRSAAPERTGNTDSAIAGATEQSAAGCVAAFRWQGFQANSIRLARTPGKRHGTSGCARSFRIDRIGMAFPTPRTGFSGQ